MAHITISILPEAPVLPSITRTGTFAQSLFYIPSNVKLFPSWRSIELPCWPFLPGKLMHCNYRFVSPTVELNDIFPLVFGPAATAALYWGTLPPCHFAKDCIAGMAMGITLYGISYFIGHDVVAHERLGTPLAQWLRSLSPAMEECARVHRKYHHTAKDQQGDPYGPPYGFWLGPYEVECMRNGQAYAPMPVWARLSLRTSWYAALAACAVQAVVLLW